ncbi:metH, partial [Symbiodinium necroappetens]
MVAAVSADPVPQLLRGHWLDSIGHSILVSKTTDEDQIFTAVLTPLVDHPEAKDRVLRIDRPAESRQWRCGNASLELADEQNQRLVWITEDGRRSVWSRTKEVLAPSGGSDRSPVSRSGEREAPEDSDKDVDRIAFPWLLNNSAPEPWLPLDVPRDILYDGARVAALLDIRQMIGARSEPQERFTHILMDHDLHPTRQGGDYLIPGVDSPLWQTLNVSETMRRSIVQRISRIPHEVLSQRVSWSGNAEVWVGRHKISCRSRDIQALNARWVPPLQDERKPLEIAKSSLN